MPSLAHELLGLSLQAPGILPGILQQLPLARGEPARTSATLTGIQCIHKALQSLHCLVEKDSALRSYVAVSQCMVNRWDCSYEALSWVC